MKARQGWGLISLLSLACGAGALRVTPHDERQAVLEMQSTGGEGGMGDVVGLALLPDSSLVVGDADDAQLVRISANGSVVTRIGKRGASIGEFSRLQWVGTCANVTVAHDIALSRLSMYDQALTVTASHTIPKAFDSRDVAGCLADGRVVILNDSFPHPPSGVTRRPLAIVSLDLHSGRADTLRKFEGSDFNYIKHLGTSIIVPLGARTLVSATPNGLIVAESDRDSLWRYDGNAWRAVALQGVPAAQRPSSADNERARLALTWAPRTSQDRAFAPSLLKETVTASQTPRIDGLIASDNGTAWIGLQPASNGQREWVEYDGNGKRVASAQFVWTFEPRLVRGSSWWGVQRDSIGVETAVRYRVADK
jgi:hypothetical protein